MTQALNSKQFADQFMEYVEDMRAHPELYKGWKSGIADLDAIMGGILRKRFYVVGGRQKGGKSALMVTVAIELNKQGVKVLYISLEMDNIEMATRVFSNQGSVDMTKFRDVQINAGDIMSLRSVQTKIASFPGYWDYGTSGINDIVKIIDEVKPDVVIVDYFQLMDSEGSKRNEGLASLSRRLKKLTLRKAPAHPVTIIVPSQVNRASIRSEQMDANAFLDTGALERDCDVALMVTDVKDENGDVVSNKRKIKIVASRVSGVGEVEVYFNGARSLMADALPQETDVRQQWYNEH
jgi:replicative DNA helicase